jgi:hypothetical protein
MARTPELLDVQGEFTLRPVSKAILTSVMEAYVEDPESAKAALPWLRNDRDITRQLSDMLHDLEHLSNADRVHSGRYMMVQRLHWADWVVMKCN